MTSLSFTKQGTSLTSLPSLSMQTITALNYLLAGKPVMKPKVQKLNQLASIFQEDIILSWAVQKRSWAGCDLARSKTAAVKVIVTTGIAAQAQLLTSQTTRLGHTTCHMALNIISIIQAYWHVFTSSSPLCICLNINCTKLSRAYIFLKQKQT